MNVKKQSGQESKMSSNKSFLKIKLVFRATYDVYTLKEFTSFTGSQYLLNIAVKNPYTAQSRS